jgi:hypothetical protein
MGRSENGPANKCNEDDGETEAERDGRVGEVETATACARNDHTVYLSL